MEETINTYRILATPLESGHCYVQKEDGRITST
jgi:hypothetical protein